MEHLDESFQIENTLIYYHNLFTHFGFYKIFPELEKEVAGYYGIIESSLKTTGFINKYQRFEIPIQLLESDYYNLHWRILRPESYNIKPVLVSTENKNIYCDPTRIYQNKVDYYSRMTDTPPIIIARIHAIDKLIVIDGNHRFSALRKKGAEQANAIILEPNQHVKYLLSEQMQALYKVHHNLSFLHKIFIKSSNTPKYCTDYSLSLNSYYPLNNSIKFRKRDNLLWLLYSLRKRLELLLIEKHILIKK